jgi:plastocyanin
LPHVLAVDQGPIVDFPNNDTTYHNVFSISKAAKFDLGRYARGQVEVGAFEQPGVVRIFCDIHSHMSAFVLVFSHPTMRKRRPTAAIESTMCRRDVHRIGVA